MLKACALMIGAGIGALLASAIDPSHHGWGIIAAFIGGFVAWMIADFASFKEAVRTKAKRRAYPLLGFVFWSQMLAAGAVWWTAFTLLINCSMIGTYYFDHAAYAKFWHQDGIGDFENIALGFASSMILAILIGFLWGFYRAVRYLFSSEKNQYVAYDIENALNFALWANPIGLPIRFFLGIANSLVQLWYEVSWHVPRLWEFIHTNIGAYYVTYGTAGVLIGYFAGFSANVSVFQLHIAGLTISVSVLAAIVGAAAGDILACLGRALFFSKSPART